MLTDGQVKRSVKRLVKANIIETKLKKFNGSPTTHYRLKQAEFQKAFLEYLKTGNSIITKKRNGTVQNGQMDSIKMYKSNDVNDVNPIEQNGQIDLDKKGETLTETTTKHTSKITSKEKTKQENPLSEKSNFNDFEILDDVKSVVPKEKSSAKKEKVILPFESKDFQQLWESWKTYRQENYQKRYSSIEEQAALMPLQNYDETFAKQLITQAIANSWKNFHFDNTPVKYQDFLIHKSKNNGTIKANHQKQQIIQKFKHDWSRFDNL